MAILIKNLMDAPPMVRKEKTLKNEEITQDEYYKWKINWTDSSKKHKEIYD